MIYARIFSSQRDAFTIFPKDLESALKALKQTKYNIAKRIKVVGKEFITFNDTRDFITISN